MNAANEREQWLQTLKENASGSEKNWWVTFLLSVLLGWCGADRFYLDQPILGGLKLITMGGFFVWWAVDVTLLLSNAMRDGNGGMVRRAGKSKRSD